MDITFTGGQGAVFTIFGGATFDLLGDGQMAWSGSGARAVLQNSGTVRKTSAAGIAAIDYVCTNNGTFSSLNGTIYFQNTYRQNSGQTLLAGGHYQAVLLDINGGSLTGTGNITGPVRNNGGVAPGSPLGQLTITGGFNYTNTAAGTYFIQLGGTNRGVSYDSITVNGTANLSGSLNVSFTNGFIPPIGSIYTAVTFTARSGVFTNSNAGLLGLTELYTPTNLLLIADNAMPTVGFTVFAGATQLVCQPFKLSATASDLDGVITNLAILLNGTPIAQTTNSTLTTTLEIDYPALYTLEARALDNKGAVATTNTTMTLVTLPLHVLSLGGVRTNAAFKFCMLGQVGSNYLVQATTNLTSPITNWSSLGLMESTNGIFRFTDAGARTNHLYRYYRTVQQ